MCGIGGIYSNKMPVPPAWIEALAGCLRHRGPDDEGYLAADIVRDEISLLTGDESKTEGKHIKRFNGSLNLYLAHRRLSIIDMSAAGHQPMSNNKGSCWIIFNGEIYNYLELRKELKALGYDFRSNTDSEVVLAAYEIWGRDCVSRFNGMWAFVVFDSARRVLFGSRDRLGVKPLYYYVGPDRFAFASEIKALLILPFIEKKINHAAVFDYLAIGLQENEEEGFIKGIYELLPSHNFEFDLTTGVFNKWRYYTLAYTDEWEDFTGKKFRRYSAETRDLLFNAVRIRLRSDVPIGSCLSGGIDSSIIVCLIHDLLKKEKIPSIGEKQKVFTASYNMWHEDESKWAKVVAEATHASWFRTYPGADQFLKDLEDLVYAQDVPFSSTSTYSQYRVMKLASENNIKVLLDGQGGDELFAGYPEYYRAFFAEILRKGKARRLVAEVRGLKNSPASMQTVASSLVRLLGVRFLPAGMLDVLLRQTIRANKYISGDLWRECRHRLEAVHNTAVMSLNEMLCRYMVGPNLKTLLRYEDRNSMKFSIESRTPFADDIHLIEHMFRIPSSYKIYRGWSKSLLRSSMSDILPEEIRVRSDKIGFSTPEHAWLNDIKDDLKAYTTNDLNDFLDVRSLMKDWEMLSQGTANIWRIINLGVWKKTMIRC